MNERPPKNAVLRMDLFDQRQRDHIADWLQAMSTQFRLWRPEPAQDGPGSPSADPEPQDTGEGTEAAGGAPGGSSVEDVDAILAAIEVGKGLARFDTIERPSPAALNRFRDSVIADFRNARTREAWGKANDRLNAFVCHYGTQLQKNDVDPLLIVRDKRWDIITEEDPAP